MTAPYGIGTPAATAITAGGKVLKDSATGDTHGSRRIDSVTRDYVLDSTGRIGGMSDTKQLVLIAVQTTVGTSAMRTLGNEIRKIDRITSNFARRIDTTLRGCVQHIVDRGLIEVIDTSVKVVRPGVALARLRWRDLASGVEEETLVGDQVPGL